MTSLHHLRGFLILLPFLAFLVATGSGQTLTAHDGSVANLSIGETYRIYVDDTFTTQVAPKMNGGEYATAMKFTIAANPGTIVTVGFVLPAAVVRSLQPMPCTYDSTSGALVEESHKRWNPQNQDTITIGSGGSATIDLGVRI